MDIDVIVRYITLVLVAIVAVFIAFADSLKAALGFNDRQREAGVYGGGPDDELITKYIRLFNASKSGYKYETITNAIFNDHVKVGEFTTHLGGYEKRKRLRNKQNNGEEILDSDLPWLFVNDASLGEIYIELDGYNHAAKLAFEYNGPLHYGKRPNEKDIDYQKRRQNDQTKRALMAEHGLNLLVIPYTITNIDCRARKLRGDDCLRENIKSLLKYIRSRLADLNMLKKGDWMGPNGRPYGYVAPAAEPYNTNDLKTHVEVDRGTGKILQTKVDAATIAEIERAAAEEDTWETAGNSNKKSTRRK
ncbi:hypothetical protein D5b_00214 [Faustovirus]|nr:hypothetical protein D5b_00214 [Faustovirus]AMN84700.1 hypothetical protein D6_00297 [Faustovirus]AMP44168.1 hypothetical protein PRJ_Dakar_00212 [Faustovirus]